MTVNRQTSITQLFIKTTSHSMILIIHQKTKGFSQTSTDSAASFCTVIKNSSACEHATSVVPQSTLVMTGQVLVESASGQCTKASALLDTGATISLMTSKLAHQLHLLNELCSLSLTGVTGTANGNISLMVSFSLLQISRANMLNFMCKLQWSEIFPICSSAVSRF